MAAAGGIVGLAAGAQMMDPDRSRRTRRTSNRILEALGRKGEA